MFQQNILGNEELENVNSAELTLKKKGWDIRVVSTTLHIGNVQFGSLCIQKAFKFQILKYRL